MLEKVRTLPEFVASNGRVFWIWFFLLGGSLSFVSFLYAAVISKLLPPSDNVVIRAIQNDCSRFDCCSLSLAPRWVNDGYIGYRSCP
ncbi:hypothetical protein Sango_0984500 [Sesamum angolense]|uniref:Uncharacterized protein n=1 Tax=Sesamum angolense TaxID=2727404 RepID=A0AAE2BYG2_9LAMI|nr:hypothetical protein Sango_0984500 [Sesamum angolense]